MHEERTREPLNGRHLGASRQRGGRALRSATAVALVLSLLVGVALFSPQVRARLAALVGDTAVPSRPVYLEHGVPWGALTLDGAAVDATGSEAHATALPLGAGTHRLVYVAEYFPRLECTISVPSRASDTCPLVSKPTTFERQVILRAGTGRIVDLGAVPSRLSEGARATLLAATEQHLASLHTTAAVPVGTRYRDASGGVALAAAPMTAQVAYTLNMDPSSTAPRSNASAGPTCLTLCAANTASSVLPDGTAAWAIVAHVVVRWTYTPASGGQRPIGGMPAAVPAVADQALPLSLQRDGPQGWKVSPLPVPGLSPLCALAAEQVRAEAVPFDPTVQVSIYAAQAPAEGCVFVGISDRSPRVTLRVMYRFGVVLAVDETSHAARPALAVASAADVATAASIQGTGTRFGMVLA